MTWFWSSLSLFCVFSSSNADATKMERFASCVRGVSIFRVEIHCFAISVYLCECKSVSCQIHDASLGCLYWWDPLDMEIVWLCEWVLSLIVSVLCCRCGLPFVYCFLLNCILFTFLQFPGVDKSKISTHYSLLFLYMRKTTFFLFCWE